MENKCPQLVEWSGGIILMCKEGNIAHVPNLSEINSYCRTKTYSKCHFYMQSNNFTPAVKKVSNNINKKI
jgi:hypothetical protein